MGKIAELKTWVDDEGRKVFEFLPIEDPTSTSYSGEGKVILKNDQEAPFHFSFPESTLTKEDAFDIFDETLEEEAINWQTEQKAKLEEMRKEQGKKIIKPGGGGGPRIIKPGG